LTQEEKAEIAISLNNNNSPKAKAIVQTIDTETQRKTMNSKTAGLEYNKAVSAFRQTTALDSTLGQYTPRGEGFLSPIFKPELSHIMGSTSDDDQSKKAAVYVAMHDIITAGKGADDLTFMGGITERLGGNAELRKQVYETARKAQGDESAKKKINEAYEGAKQVLSIDAFIKGEGGKGVSPGEIAAPGAAAKFAVLEKNNEVLSLMIDQIKALVETIGTTGLNVKVVGF
jgi:hypothetical protein